MTTAIKQDNHAEQQARAQLESIVEMVAARQTDNAGAREEAEQNIQEDALSVEVRADWHNPGDTEQSKPTEYKILLCTGGPAVQIRGELNRWLEPETA